MTGFICNFCGISAGPRLGDMVLAFEDPDTHEQIDLKIDQENSIALFHALLRAMAAAHDPIAEALCEIMPNVLAEINRCLAEWSN
jgi:hypothetical protein